MNKMQCALTNFIDNDNSLDKNRLNDIVKNPFKRLLFFHDSYHIRPLKNNFPRIQVSAKVLLRLKNFSSNKRTFLGHPVYFDGLVTHRLFPSYTLVDHSRINRLERNYGL